jgi:hypothetical protein
MDPQNPEYNPTDPVPDAGANDVVAPGGNVNDSAVGLKDVVKQLTGRDYPTDEAAAEGIKNTYQMVGKKSEPQVVEKTVVDPEITTKVSALEKQLQETTFYAQNPEYNNEDFKALVNLSGKAPSELIASQDFKAQYEKIKAYNEIEKSKSVLQTNSRLGTVTDKFSQAQEALKAGDTNTAKNAAVGAVLDAYPELRG